MLHSDVLLKNNELCLVGRSADRGGMHEAGLYLRDTRFLSQFTVSVSGTPLDVLSVQTLSGIEAIISSTPATGHRLENAIGTSTLVVHQRISIGAALDITFDVQAFGGWTREVSLEIELRADFRDMFDVRGMVPKRRPTLHQPAVGDDGSVSLAATGADGQTVRLDVASTPRPSFAEAAMVKRESDDVAIPVKLTFGLDLSDGEIHSVQLALLPVPVGTPQEPAPAGETRLNVSSNNPDLDAFVHRADLDLAMLQTSFPEGSMPAAGIPWFIAPFGCDSLIVALQTMHVYPERVWSTLRVLAAHQGAKLDPFREEEPGKILHELRYGDMARSGQIPHTPYFGSIDSTPLFVMAFAQAYRWHRDEGMYDGLISHVHRALAWIEEYGDLDGDGLVEFGDKSEDSVHITQQGWKDSHDSLHWANGDEVDGPIALVEVQGYFYAAYAWLAIVAEMRGDSTWAAELRNKAEQIREAVESSYWLPETGFYAQALDGEKRPVDQISSNPGHLLYCGLPSPERAASVAERLMQPDMLTRWGIRTLSSKMSRYNPMSYHNGSVWPHDNSLIMVGLRNYGFTDASSTIAEALIRLSAHGPERRLSELYCGFDDEDERLGPVNYPVSCRPQAWAAGCAHMIVQTILGFDTGSDPVEHRIRRGSGHHDVDRGHRGGRPVVDRPD
ncbi:MAG: amylo-alpha-1,6-glucosidase [Chloroflexota bacterium]|nr:amylo-alpha-1,6-glucosidase [Chloroflexota bacterium]